MEYEIDLGRYLRALGYRWYWILIAAVICAVIGFLMSLMQQTTYTAMASVFFRPTRSQVQLDQRFITDETIDIASQRTTLLTLANSPSIGALLPAQPLTQLGITVKNTTDLADRIDVKASGDLIDIIASGETPEQARSLADAWAAAFVEHVNQLYTQTSPSASNEQIEARYEAAQKAFEQFTGSNRINELDQRIAATESVITRTLKAEQIRYESYLARANQLDLMLRDAETLRGQLAGAESLSLGDSIALLTLRTRISSGTQPGAVDGSPVQLQIDLPTVIERGESITLQDVDLLIETLRKEIEDTRAAASTLAEGLVAKGHTIDSSVTEQNRATYYSQLSALMEQREVEEGRRLALEQERDVALDALQVARSKAAEQEVAAVRPDVEVRLAGSATLPDAPDGVGTTIMVVVGAVGGVLMTMILIILVEAWTGISPLPRRSPSTERGTPLGSTAKQA